MDKFQLQKELVESLGKKGFKPRIIYDEPKSNPLFETVRKGKSIYVVICEAGIKPARHKDIVFCGISPKIQSHIEEKETFVVIIDSQSVRPEYVLVKLDDTNHRRNKIGYIIFHFKRPEYGGFFHTRDKNEVLDELQNIVKLRL